MALTQSVERHLVRSSLLSFTPNHTVNTLSQPHLRLPEAVSYCMTLPVYYSLFPRDETRNSHPRWPGNWQLNANWNQKTVVLSLFWFQNLKRDIDWWFWTSFEVDAPGKDTDGKVTEVTEDDCVREHWATGADTETETSGAHSNTGDDDDDCLYSSWEMQEEYRRFMMLFLLLRLVALLEALYVQM